MSEVTIEAESLGKEYHFQTIFQNFNYSFSHSQSVAVLGANGSGKSTLLKVLSGMAESTQGHIHWWLDGVKLSEYHWFKFLSFCSPDFHFDYRFTVEEIIRQYTSVKPLQNQLTPEQVIDIIGFQSHSHKKMNELSSGMNQRVRLVLSVCADVPVLFLDEPCSNLDHQGVLWYHGLIQKYSGGKLIIVASNDPREYDFCEKQLSLMDYK